MYVYGVLYTVYIVCVRVLESLYSVWMCALYNLNSVSAYILCVCVCVYGRLGSGYVCKAPEIGP